MEIIFSVLSFAAIIMVVVQYNKIAALKRDVLALNEGLRRVSLDLNKLTAEEKPPALSPEPVVVEAEQKEVGESPTVREQTAATEATATSPALPAPPTSGAPLVRPAALWPQRPPQEDKAKRSSRAWGGATRSSPLTSEPSATTGAAEAPDLAAGAGPSPYHPHPVPEMSFEQRLTTHWFVWIGGAAIALGGIYFIDFARQVGLLSPATIVNLAILAGCALMLLGGKIAKRAVAQGQEMGYVPASLSAAGLIITFGSLYAADTVYQLISTEFAFLAMSGVALFGLFLSLRQGPLVAALGFLGSYITPLMLYDYHLSATVLFSYLLIILVACFVIARLKSWWRLGFLSLGGAFIWACAWLRVSDVSDGLLTGLVVPATPSAMSDTIVLGLFALALGTVPLILLRSFLPRRELAHKAKNPAELLVFVGFLAQALVLEGLVIVTNYTTASLVFLALGMAEIVAFAWRRDYRYGGLYPAGLVGLLLLIWPEKSFLTSAMDEMGQWSSVPQHGLSPFLIWLALFGGGFISCGLAGYIGKKRLDGWALLAAATAAVYPVIGWFRYSPYYENNQAWSFFWPWLVVAVALTLLLLAALFKPTLKKEGRHFDLAQIYLFSGAALLSVFVCWLNWRGLAFIISLSVVTVALAGFVALAKRPILGIVSGMMGTICALLLYTSRDSWDGSYMAVAGEHWPLIAYGVPSLLFYLSSLLLTRAGSKDGVITLKALSLTMLMTLSVLEVRILIAGRVTATHFGLLECATDCVIWLIAAYGLLHKQKAKPGFVSLWGAQILLVVACFGLILGCLFRLNPLLTHEAIAGSMLINSLALAYLIPALLLALIAPRLKVIGWQEWRPLVGGLVMVLLLTYVTLEIKRLFQGPDLSWAIRSTAENYAYSAAWLVLGVVLFLSGLKLKQRYLRYAGLGVMVLVILKVFLWDMSDLPGVFRVLSLIGLGFSLVGIGWLDGRYFARKTISEENPAERHEI